MTSSTSLDVIHSKQQCKRFVVNDSFIDLASGVNPAGDRGIRPPEKNVGWGTVMHHVPSNMAEIKFLKRQRISLIVVSYYDLVYVLSAFSAWVLFVD